MMNHIARLFTIAVLLSLSFTTHVRAQTVPEQTGYSSQTESSSAVTTGLSSNPIVDENALPGTPGWRIDVNNRAMGYEIGGYIPMPSVTQGSSIPVHINRTGADATQAYTVEVFRLGWYGGVGARRVYGPATETGGGSNLPIAQVTVVETGLYETNWPVGFTLATQTDGVPWTTGSFAIRLTSSSGKQVYVPFTLKTTTPSDFWLLQSHLTWQVYNEVTLRDGNSLYNWGTRFVTTRNCNWWFGSTCLWWGGYTIRDTLPQLPNYGDTAMQVSFKRPYGPWFRISDGAGETLYYEWPLIMWLEREGFNVSYGADFDLEFAPVPAGVRSVILPAHSEYWTEAMRDNLEAAQASGVGLLSFGANQMYWRGRIENPTPDHVGVYTLYKQNGGASRPDDPLYGNTDLQSGQFRALGNPEQLVLGSQFRSYFSGANKSVTGKQYHGYINLGPAVDANHPLLAGTGITSGEVFPALMGGEFDQVMTNYPSLPNVQKLFRTFVHASWYPSNSTSWEILLCSWGFTSSCRHTYAESVVVEKTDSQSGEVSRVFNAGTFNWMWGLSTFTLYDGTYAWENPDIQALTRNLLLWSAKLDDSQP